MVLEMVGNVKALLSETELLLSGKMSMVPVLPRHGVRVLRVVLTRLFLLSVQQLDPPQQEQLNVALNSVAQHLRRLADVPWLCPAIDPSDHEVNHLVWITVLLRLTHSCLTNCSSLSLGPFDRFFQAKSERQVSSCPKVQKRQKQ